MSNIPRLISEKEVRDNKRYKQVDIVEATNLSPSMVSRLLRGAISIDKVTLGVLIDLAEWLECGIEDMYTKETTESN